MNYLEAINERRSRRLYLQKPIDWSKLSVLQEMIDRFNRESTLSIRFIEDGSAAFGNFRKTYGLFSGIRSLLVMVGKKNDANLKEKIGYYGELLVLEATCLGLGTCWVGVTFNAESPVFGLKKEETLVCVIPIGYVEELSFREKMIHQMVAGKSKSIPSMLVSNVNPPDWLLSGIKAVQKAPSAVNKQPVHFEYKAGILTVFVEDDGKFSLVDLGIAKAHFEQAAIGRFERGNNARFIF
jgi:hypothetical protein